MQTRKIFDMGKTHTPGKDKARAMQLQKKKISITGIHTGIEDAPKSPKEDERIADLQEKIDQQKARIARMKDGPMREKSKGKLSRMKKQLKKLQREP